MMRESSNRRVFHQAGLTLIELMVGIVLALLIIAAIGAAYIQNQRSYLQDDAVSRMQENARYALQVLSHDISLTGFWGRVFYPDTINSDSTLTNVGIGTDCGPTGVSWAYDTTANLVRYSPAVAGTDANGEYACITNAEFLGGTSILALKHAANTNVEDVDLANNVVYLRTNGTDGILFYGSTPPTLPPVPGSTTPNWPLVANVYFVRNYSITTGDGIPTLCRESLQPGATPTISTDSGCIAENIERFEVFFGVDTDADGSANQYVNNPTPVELVNSVSARIFLLARAPAQDFQYTDTKTYKLGSVTLGPYGDRYHRRVFTTTVLLRNPSNLIRAGY